jgi:hypothetical protein
MTESIKAHVRMEERYEGLSLTFGDNPELKAKVMEAIEAAKKETGLNPDIFGNPGGKEHPEREGVYLEFHEDAQRDAGDFFERVLHRLGVVCEKDD